MYLLSIDLCVALAARTKGFSGRFCGICIPFRERGEQGVPQERAAIRRNNSEKFPPAHQIVQIPDAEETCVPPGQHRKTRGRSTEAGGNQ